MVRNRVAGVLALCLGIVACERPTTEQPPPGQPPAQPTEIAVGDPAMAERAECHNRTEGYVVEYPAGWNVNSNDILGPCRLFNPGPIQIPRDSELPIDIAVTIWLEPVDFETLTGEVMGRRVISREETTVDGREAMRIEGETTGEGLHDRGIRTYEYFVHLGDTTMAASTYDVGDLPFERKRRILDDMMETFDFVRPG
jgi:hypothetical protein